MFGNFTLNSAIKAFLFKRLIMICVNLNPDSRVWNLGSISWAGVVVCLLIGWLVYGLRGLLVELFVVEGLSCSGTLPYFIFIHAAQVLGCLCVCL